MLIEDEILTIEEYGEIETIDINLDGNRLFLANGILTHNSAIDATELNQSHIAGGISKVNTADWYLSIIFNNSMRAMGDIIFLFLKSRSSDAVGKQVLLKWVNNRLRITDSDKKLQSDVIVEQVASKTKNKSLLDIMDL